MQQNLFKGSVVRAGLIAGLVGVIVLLLSLVPVVGFCIGLFVWVVYVGAGVLAVYTGRAENAAATIQQAGIDGAVAGGIAGLIAHVIKWVVDVALGLVFTFTGASDPGSVIGQLIQLIVLGLIGVVISILVAAILGAIGGLVYRAIKPQPTVV